MKSMTGYGVSHSHKSDYGIEVIVQSFNSRYLELDVQVLPFHASLKGDVRKVIQKHFLRGHIDVTVNRNPKWPKKEVKISWNRKQASRWKTIYNQMAKKLNMKNNLDLLTLANQTSVLEAFSWSASLSAQEKKTVRRLVKKAIQLCERERVREGKVLKKDFQKHLRDLSRSLRFIQSRSALNKKKVYKILGRRRAFRNKKKRRPNAEEMNETVLNRMDIAEELSRLKGHTKVFQSLVRSRSQVGKRMGFYLQEMVREVNTIGAKSQDFPIAQKVILAKTFIERMKEQVQNVE